VREAELKNHIVSLEKDYEAEYINNQLYREQLGKMEENEEAVCSLNIELQSLKEENCRLTENFAKEVRELNLANDLLKVENTSLTENLATVKSKIDCVKSKIAAGRGDDSSTTSGDSAMAIHVKKTAKELQSTVKAIKKHHDDTVRKLQGELEDARKRLKKYECKVNDLTTLIEENAVVIESLHEKLRGKTSEKSSFSSPRQSYSDESEVTE
jgi:chromosome segregation ATPase